jgi:glycosyltransferase involved in cell wall biosynthesis
MRILQIVHGSEPGGVKTLSEIIAGGLGTHGVIVETAHLFPKYEAGALAKLAGTLRVARKIFSEPYDAVIAYQASASILTGVAGALARRPRRIVHQTALPSEVKATLRILDRVVGALGLYTANIANATATLAAFADYPARYRRSMVLIEHGVPAPSPRRPRGATLRHFGIPDDGTILLNVGRLTAQKNQGVLIRALACLPATRLVVAGDGPLRADHERLANTLGVAGRLHLLGDAHRDEIADLLAASDLFVFPSTWETFGLAAIEAAMTGLPIIAADLPVLREVLSAGDGVATTFVPPFDVDGWVNAINAGIGALRSDTDPTRRHGASQAIAQRYGVPRMIDAYVTLLRTAPAG